MSEQLFPSGLSCALDLDQHLEAFLTALAQAGYAEKTRRDKAHRIAPFIQWLRDSEVRLGESDDDACIDAFLACPTRRRYNHRCALQAFLAYLREVEVLPQRLVEPSPGAALYQRYLTHLSSQQGLSAHSIAAYAISARGFIAATHLPEWAAHVDALVIRRYVLDVSRDHAVATVKLCAAGLRSFLRFCFLQGVIAHDLSPAVPPIGHWQRKPMPAVLTHAAGAILPSCSSPCVRIDVASPGGGDIYPDAGGDKRSATSLTVHARFLNERRSRGSPLIPR